MYRYIAKSVFSDHLGSSNDPCCIQNLAIMNRVIKRFKFRKPVFCRCEKGHRSAAR